jgi:hypothetical protein
MPHPRIPRRFVALAAAGVAGLASAAGCTHNYYYGNAVPVCEAPVVTAAAPAVSYGAVCELPPPPGQGVAQGGASAPIVADAGRAGPIITRRPPLRVVSQPSDVAGSAGSYASPYAPGTRLGWRGRDDRGAVTKVVGAFDDSETR